LDVLEQLCDDEVEPVIPAALDATPRAGAAADSFSDSARAGKKRAAISCSTSFFAMQPASPAKRVEQMAQPARCIARGFADAPAAAALPFSLTARSSARSPKSAPTRPPRPMNRLLTATWQRQNARRPQRHAPRRRGRLPGRAHGPTQILAEQHYITLRHLCEPLGLRVALRTAARTEQSGALRFSIDSKEVDDEPQFSSARMRCL